MVTVACHLSWKPWASSTSPPPVRIGHLSPADRLENPQPHYDRNQQYSIVGLTNAAGTLVERYTYSAYGTLGIYAANGTVRTSSTYANRYTYTGREWDADLNLYHFRARWYDPATGGFISKDPLGYIDGMSLYRGYFGVQGVDPSGNVRRQSDKMFLQKVQRACDGAVDEKARDVAAVTTQAATIPPPMLTCEFDCEYQWRVALARNAVAHRQWRYLVAKGCKVEIVCGSCLDLGGGTLMSGGYQAGHRRLVLCMDNIEIGDYGIALAHELTHANQHCHGENQEDCGTNLFHEMEAYHCEGDCGRNMLPDEAGQDCMLRAIRSVCPESCSTEKLTSALIERKLKLFNRLVLAGEICNFSKTRMPHIAKTDQVIPRRKRRWHWVQ